MLVLTKPIPRLRKEKQLQIVNTEYVCGPFSFNERHYAEMEVHREPRFLQIRAGVLLSVQQTDSPQLPGNLALQMQLVGPSENSMDEISKGPLTL